MKQQLAASFLILSLSSVSASISDLETCSATQQRSILPRILHCTPREEVVHLSLPNETYIHIVPNHVTVQRCGGSCMSRYQSCIPSSTRKRKIDVLLIPRTNLAGATDSVCAEAEVEEHTACACGCQVTASQCTPGKQRWVPSECRCVCANDGQRTACIERGWYWNPSMCQCMCRNPLTFPTCPTGYWFDGDSSCSCVNTTEYASTVLEILILIMASTMVMTVFGLIHCYRTKTGLFQMKGGSGSSTNGEERVQTSNVTELRALFRALSNPGNTPVNWLGYEQIGDAAQVARNSRSVLLRPDASTSSTSSNASSTSSSSSSSSATQGATARMRANNSDIAASSTNKLEPLLEKEETASNASKE